MLKIENADLMLDQIPNASADVETLIHFALSFDGYAHWGSFEKCAEIANEWVARFETRNELAPTLTLLRTCLFFEQRRWRHYDDEPDDRALVYWRALISEIRKKVEGQQLLWNKEMTHPIEFAQALKETHLAELKKFLALPTISTLSEHRADVQRGAEWVAENMRAMGMENVEIMPTGNGAGQPLVYADWLHAANAPTILVYGHFDVQPVDPLNEWLTPPFEATILGDTIYARGASDMKAQTLAVMKALEALLKTNSLRVNIKVIVEGEEEVGSPNFAPFLREHKEKLKCDVALNCDSQMATRELPSIVYGLRGLCYFEIWIHGPAQDLHSGLFGGSIHNPAQVLCDLISGMHDADGRVTLPNFYDDVRVLSQEERAALARLPVSDETWANAAGVSELWGEENFSVVERTGARPTLEVNGLYSGFIGEGSKTVLPAKAMAKISTRLVPTQRPEKIKHQLEAYLQAHAPNTVRWEVKQLAAGEPVLLNKDSRFVRAAQDALQETFGVAPVFQLLGWSVPITNNLNDELGVDVVVMGFGLPDDGTHGPNEHFYLPNFYRGIESYLRFFENLGG